MFVECIKGHPGLLEEGQIYEVTHISPKGNYHLKGIFPPPPHTVFSKERFNSLNIDDINIEEIFELVVNL
jgi:hypothetical protein